MVTPEADHLFHVSETAVKLEEEEGRDFHRATSRILFLCKRSRTAIQTAVSFLTTRVKEPTEENWKKIVRVLAYLKGTTEECFNLSTQDTKLIKWWVDGSYAVHGKMISQTGGIM